MTGKPVGLYRAYGFQIQSSWSLPLRTDSGTLPPDIDLLEASAGFFEQITSELASQLTEARWFQSVRLADGSHYMRWTGLFEFLVSADGHRIWGHALPRGTLERLQPYLLGQVVAVALVKQGIEPLHATVVVVDGEAVAFLGNTGYGKSTLGAAFIKAGFTILTDDLLVIAKSGQHFIAQPGPARIKLFPEPAEALLPGPISGVTMNSSTPKLILPLDELQAWPNAAPIKTLYLLGAPDSAPPGGEVEIRQPSRRAACIGLVENTLCTFIQGLARQAQQFNAATELAAGLDIKSLTYARDLARISHVVDAVLADLRHPVDLRVAA